MTGNCHVRFLGEGAAAMPFPYPTPLRRVAKDCRAADREEAPPSIYMDSFWLDEIGFV
jgi:hypothetical protein